MPDQETEAVQPQDAFGELARIALADHSVDSVMDKIAALTKRAVPGAHEVSVTLVEGGTVKTVAFTEPLANKLDERQYTHGYGPCLDSIAGGEPVLIVSMSADTRWRDWSDEAQAQGVSQALVAGANGSETNSG